MTDAFAALSGKIAGLTGVEGVSRLTVWVKARQDAGRRRQGVDAFIKAVDGVLAGARPGRAQISKVRTDIDNGTTTPDARARASSRSWPTARPRSPPPATSP